MAAPLPSGRSLLSSVLKLCRPSPLLQAVRGYRDRPVYTRRHGFTLEHYINGPLPRLPVTPDLKPLPVKPQQLKNPWSYKRATFGQNDYIDILGDGSLHPRDMLTEGPHWLRGFRGNEFQRLLRQRRAMFHYAPHLMPTAWRNLTKRIQYLYKYHNQKQNHKDWRHHFW
ncbi:hypothetical protein RvY_16006 [Ramazzottius varieornatus]|uniref:Large ribosomal subunit protein mL51 n=1 Tax=Ramazzottius varieornatus TaxID=947166 RepID=A0A1D1VWX0_RAMVA|nr:hypothetical protein RvY_16006 [Ramazzottius varieornatus]